MPVDLFPLNLTFNFPLSVVDEPGFHKLISTRELWEGGFPSDDTSHQGIWADPATRTLMLRPQQLESSWLNTAEQADSILRLYQPTDGSGDFYCNAADTAAQDIFEAACFGNPNNPYIFHTPVGPSSFFPGAAAPDVPGSPPSLLGVPEPTDLTTVPLLTQGPTLVLQPSLVVDPAATPPAVVPIGSAADGKFLGHTIHRLPANQALYFRWFHPSSMLGYPCIYEFFVGQYRLRVKDVTLEVFKDISPSGDRTKWKKEMIAPLFSVGDLSPTGTGSVVANVSAQSVLAHDRSLLWLPFRRNEVFLLASSGKWALLQVNGAPTRLPDDTDWDIVRSDAVQVWVLTPAAGRFQIQKVKYPAGPVKLQCKPVILDYAPPAAPVFTPELDAEHGSLVGVTDSNPPAYTIPENSANDCPTPTSSTTDRRTKWGYELAFTPSSDHRWTPFFYGAGVIRPRTFTTFPGTPGTIGDTAPGQTDWLRSITLTAGLRPGEGRMEAEVSDLYPYPLASAQFQSGYPVQLFNPTLPAINRVYFTGFANAVEHTFLPGSDTAAHRLVVPATDRWTQLSWGTMRDRRDWTGFGHIDAVAAALAQGGVDPATAEWPAGYTPGVLSTINTPLGLQAPTVGQLANDVVQGWAARDLDTPATFIQRIADLFSAWNVGFRLDGTFFYLPRFYFTTPTCVFYESTIAGPGPFLYPPLTFTTEEPEANVILVRCPDLNGTWRYSSAMIDWASVLNPNAVNFLGREKREIVELGGSFSCTQLNYIARNVWNWTRRRRYLVRFEADFALNVDGTNLEVGHLFTLGSHGNWRVQGLRVRLEHQAFHRCEYTALFDDRGYA